MKPLVPLVLALGLFGCQRDDAPAKPAAAPATTIARADDSYRGDVQRLCDSLTLSGADQAPIGERSLPLANWLAANLKTAESRQFLVQIQPLYGEPKAAALDAEAQRVGLTGCALAEEWRHPKHVDDVAP